MGDGSHDHHPRIIIDLGASPGSWCQVIRERVGLEAARVIGVDINPLAAAVPGVLFLKGDFTSLALQRQLQAEIKVVQTSAATANSSCGRQVAAGDEFESPLDDRFMLPDDDGGAALKGDGLASSTHAGPSRHSRERRARPTGEGDDKEEGGSLQQDGVEIVEAPTIHGEDKASSPFPPPTDCSSRRRRGGGGNDDERVVDVITSDMCPNRHGGPDDHHAIADLATKSFRFATRHLRDGGHFVCKLLGLAAVSDDPHVRGVMVDTLPGGDEGNLLRMVRGSFDTVDVCKPPASRAQSQELFLVCRGFRPPYGCRERRDTDGNEEDRQPPPRHPLQPHRPRDVNRTSLNKPTADRCGPNRVHVDVGSSGRSLLRQHLPLHKFRRGLDDWPGFARSPSGSRR